MDLEKAISFAESCQVGYVATCMNNKPYVRPLQLVTTGGEGFFFVTHPHKELFAQLRQNPEIEICFVRELEMLRVRGNVEWIEDPAWLITSMVEQPWAPRSEVIKAIRPNFRFFELALGICRWWEDASQPVTKEFSFSNRAPSRRTAR